MKNVSKIKVEFTKEMKDYYALFTVGLEPNGTTYHLKAEVFDSKNHKIFEKERSDLDYSQVEYALTFVFHQAFVEQ